MMLQVACYRLQVASYNKPNLQHATCNLQHFLCSPAGFDVLYKRVDLSSKVLIFW
jgi:hypothetical protein